MKIGILTWYKAINHGALLQTYASCKILESLGATPVVLDYHWQLYDNEVKGRITRCKRIIKAFSIKKVILHTKAKHNYKIKKQLFDKFVKSMLPLGKVYSEEIGLDGVYIGSDMVFDISQGYNPFMYGIDVPSNYIFSYAASFGYTTIGTLDAFSRKKEIVVGLNKLKMIGYRDQNTLDIINHFHIVPRTFECIDPVLCYGFTKENETWDTGKWQKKKYLLIYSYDSTMNDKHTTKQIKEISQRENLEIISCGYYHSWCDTCIPASPQEFVELIKHAKYVITDTFHGTVFATIMHKNFVSFIRNNGFKLRHFLEQTGLSDRIYTDTNMRVIDVLQHPVDYSNFDKWIDIKAQESIEFIRSNLNAINSFESLDLMQGG